MNLELICQWLDLPGGKWPPDHYTLLALPPKEADLELIERRTHERITAIRPYQLTYPDEVTEVLNRLAAAFNCLTDPGAKQSYDASLGRQAAAEESTRLANDRVNIDPADPLAWLFGPWSRLTIPEPRNPSTTIASNPEPTATAPTGTSPGHWLGAKPSRVWLWIIHHPGISLLICGLLAFLVALIRHWNR